jgi:hypothetical protein
MYISGMIGQIRRHSDDTYGTLNSTKWIIGVNTSFPKKFGNGSHYILAQVQPRCNQTPRLNGSFCLKTHIFIELNRLPHRKEVIRLGWCSEYSFCFRICQFLHHCTNLKHNTPLLKTMWVLLQRQHFLMNISKAHSISTVKRQMLMGFQVPKPAY